MDVNLTLIVLTMSKAELQLVLPCDKHELLSVSLGQSEPDALAAALASDLSGESDGIQRHGFLSPGEAKTGVLTLLYTQLLPEDQLQSDRSESMRLIPLEAVGEVLSTPEADMVKRVVSDLKADLDQVMHSRLNKRGLIHLLSLLPDIFDHKELAAAYYAFTGEKPPSALMLARMMLDRYTMGSGEKQREVKGRDLIREYDGSEPELLDRKWDKNKELYRTGGPKAKRLYKKNIAG